MTCSGVAIVATKNTHNHFKKSFNVHACPPAPINQSHFTPATYPKNHYTIALTFYGHLNNPPCYTRPLRLLHYG